MIVRREASPARTAAHRHALPRISTHRREPTPRHRPTDTSAPASGRLESHRLRGGRVHRDARAGGAAMFAMKTRLLMPLFAAAAVIGSLACSATSSDDSVVQARDVNETRFANDKALREASSFLVEMADARMMDGQEGEVAASRGQAPDVTAYGAKMVKEQAVLLDEIRALASELHVALPQQISADKADGLRDLKAKSGTDLDSKFVKMIRIDHERDVKEFTKATKLANARIAQWAQQRLPTIEAHLAEIEAIKAAR
jgi:putative membrane protein